MSWRRPGATSHHLNQWWLLLTHICVTRPQWVLRGVASLNDVHVKKIQILLHCREKFLWGNIMIFILCHWKSFLLNSIFNIFFPQLSGLSTKFLALNAGLILDLHPANERRRYKVMPSLIGWKQAYKSALHCKCRNTRYKDKTVSSLRWESLYLYDGVFILNRLIVATHLLTASKIKKKKQGSSGRLFQHLLSNISTHIDPPPVTDGFVFSRR